THRITPPRSAAEGISPCGWVRRSMWPQLCGGPNEEGFIRSAKPLRGLHPSWAQALRIKLIERNRQPPTMGIESRGALAPAAPTTCARPAIPQHPVSRGQGRDAHEVSAATTPGRISSPVALERAGSILPTLTIGPLPQTGQGVGVLGAASSFVAWG